MYFRFGGRHVRFAENLNIIYITKFSHYKSQVKSNKSQFHHVYQSIINLNVLTYLNLLTGDMMDGLQVV